MSNPENPQRPSLTVVGNTNSSTATIRNFDEDSELEILLCEGIRDPQHAESGLIAVQQAMRALAGEADSPLANTLRFWYCRRRETA